MGVEDRTRHERLRALLPQAYATDPRDSVLGVMLDVLADGLRELDQATERALRDKWLATAEADREPVDPSAEVPTIELGGEPRPLEHLGAALDLLRQPWEVDEEAYRARVARLAPLMSHGLGTTRALLMFTITALGGEPCSRLECQGDTTTAIGLAPGRHARCRECRAGAGVLTGTCPMRDEAIMTASLVDNPRGTVRVGRDALQPGEDGEATIRFESNSLFADRPELELRVPIGQATKFDDQHFDEATFVEDDSRVVPSFRSRRTGERIVVPRSLHLGDVLTILPVSPYESGVPDHLQQWVDRSSGSNRSTAIARIKRLDVDVPENVPVIIVVGPTFDGAHFGGDRFASEVGTPGAVENTTPAVLPGANVWDYAPLDEDELVAVLTAASLEIPASLDVGDADLRPVSLRLRWWARPIAHVLIRIPLTDAVRRVIDLGAADYVRSLVDRARAIGVTVEIAFVEPPFREELDPLDGLRGLDLAIVEELPPLDSTRFGPSLPGEVLDDLQARLGIVGLFDVVPFELGVFAE